MNRIELEVDAKLISRRVLQACLAAELSFVVLDYHLNYGQLTNIGALRRMFNIGREDGLASWFAISQTLLIALTLWLIYVLVRHGYNPRRKVYGWFLLATFFTYMAIDDGVQIHERLGTTVKTLREAHGATVDFFPSYTWQLVFLPLFAALGLFTLCFLWIELETRASRLALLIAVSLLVFAVVLDFVEGLDPDHPWNAYTLAIERFDLDPWTRARFGKSDFDTLRHFSKSVEETIEMMANTVFWFLFIRHLPRVAEQIETRVH